MSHDIVPFWYFVMESTSLHWLMKIFTINIRQTFHINTKMKNDLIKNRKCVFQCDERNKNREIKVPYSHEKIRYPLSSSKNSFRQIQHFFSECFHNRSVTRISSVYCFFLLPLQLWSPIIEGRVIVMGETHGHPLIDDSP